MPELPEYEAAIARVMALTYPPTTLRIPPARAVGHRLARPVIAKGNQPLRPISLVDGLAVITNDILAARPASGRDDAPSAADEAREAAEQQPADAPLETESAEALERGNETALDDDLPAELALSFSPKRRHHAEDEAPVAAAPTEAELSAAPEDDDDTAEAEAAPEAAPGGRDLGVASLELRTAPASNRREDSLQSGQAVAVAAGAEVPRGAGMIYPLDIIAGEPGTAAPPSTTVQSAQPEDGEANGENGEDDKLPVAEPPRDWDLVQRYAKGAVELPLLAAKPARNMIAVGDWARNREPILPERSVIRAGEVALLAALEVDEVEVYRRPVVGVASLALPFPHPQHGPDEALDQRPCPLMITVTELVRAAHVAALPLGYAPKRFRTLLGQIEKWLEQVDVLVLVGGSHHGTRRLGRDLLEAVGKVELDGTGFAPCECISAGMIKDHPVLVLPGSMPQALAGFVLFGRPLAHKYLAPGNFSPKIELKLEHGSRLRFDTPCAIPVRYGQDGDSGALTTRFGGRMHDQWLDYIRGQALVLFEAGRRYEDGEIVPAYAY